jgi:ADP-ribose pyrophosphatase
MVAMTFTKLTSQSVYQGRAFNVERVLVQLPDGQEKNYDLVAHRDSVTIIPVDAQAQMYFVCQYRLGGDEYLLELPAGVLEPGEDPVEGARREVREETGMSAGKLLNIGEMYLAPGYSTELMTVFLATDLRHEPLAADADEFLDLVLYPVSEAYRLAENRLIRDSKTLAALLLARKHLV